MIVGNGVAGLWALAAHRVEGLRTPALWWCTALVEVSVFVEVGLGVAMVSGQKRPVEQFHMFYGFLCIVVVGILYSYRQQLRRWQYLLYGLGGLFVMGLAIRALSLGR